MKTIFYGGKSVLVIPELAPKDTQDDLLGLFSNVLIRRSRGSKSKGELCEIQKTCKQMFLVHRGSSPRDDQVHASMKCLNTVKSEDKGCVRCLCFPEMGARDKNLQF